MRSYCCRTVGGAAARESTSAQADLEPYSPLAKFLGEPAVGKTVGISGIYPLVMTNIAIENGD